MFYIQFYVLHQYRRETRASVYVFCMYCIRICSYTYIYDVTSDMSCSPRVVTASFWLQHHCPMLLAGRRGDHIINNVILYRLHTVHQNVANTRLEYLNEHPLLLIFLREVFRNQIKRILRVTQPCQLLTYALLYHIHWNADRIRLSLF